MSNSGCFGVLPEYWHPEYKMNHQDVEELPLRAKQDSEQVALVKIFGDGVGRVQLVTRVSWV